MSPAVGEKILQKHNRTESLGRGGVWQEKYKCKRMEAGKRETVMELWTCKVPERSSRRYRAAGRQGWVRRNWDFSPRGWSFGWRVRLPMQETTVWTLDREDPLEKEMTTHSSILAREALEKCDHIFPREISPCWWSDFTGAGGEGWALGTCWAVSRMLLVEPKAEVVGV